MLEKGKAALVHFLLSFLLTIGLLMPVLKVLLPDQSPVLPLTLAGALCLAASCLCLSRPSAIAGAGLLLAGVLACALQPGLRILVSDALRALTLRFYGQMAALPLVGREVTLFLTFLFSLLCFLITFPAVSFFPSTLLCVGAALILWLSGAQEQLPWLLPGLAASLTLMLLDRHPSTSALRLLPSAAALIALAFFLTPQAGVTVEPLREQADALRQAILDRLFFTEPRDVFSLSTEGLYPQGYGQMGGTPSQSDHPVMQVSTPRKTYLRGVILNEYNGRAWYNTTGGRRYLWQSRSLGDSRSRLFDQALPAFLGENALTAPSTVSVRMLSDSASTLFVPQRIRQLTPGGSLVPYFSSSSEVFATRNLQAGDTWTVSAPLFLAGDAGLATLIDACASYADPQWDAVADTYTRLPSHLGQALYDLAAEITAAARTPYEKAFALQTWLTRNCRYTLEVADQPGDVDFVSAFLLDTRQGYCTYFASALTVLCRMVHLPARYVEGYLAEPGPGGEALVTGLDAHAWTEVYLNGFGWLTFDATPARRSDAPGESDPPQSDRPDDSPEPSPEPEDAPSPEPEDAPSPEPEDAPSREQPDEPTPTPGQEAAPSPDAPSAPPQSETASPEEDASRRNEKEPPKGLWLLLILLLLLLALLLRWLQTSPERRARAADSEEKRFEIWMQEIHDRLAAEGMQRRRGESPMAFARRVDLTARFSEALSPVGECLSLMRYSRALPLASDTALLRDTARVLRKDLSAPARLRYALRRLLIPVRKRDYAS